jgi:hypothetical protein
MPRLSLVPGSQSGSSSVGSDILARVRALLNEATANFWDDNDIYQWITDGVIDITGKTYCTGAVETVALVDGTLEYSIVADYIDIVAVVYNNTKSLLLGHPSMLGHVADPGEVVYYYEWDGKIGYIPKPQSTDNALNTVLYYIPMPADIVAGTSIPLPKWLDDPLVLYATAMALFEDNELTTAQQTMRAYEDAIQKYTKAITADQPNQANDVRGK